MWRLQRYFLSLFGISLSLKFHIYRETVLFKPWVYPWELINVVVIFAPQEISRPMVSIVGGTLTEQAELYGSAVEGRQRD